MVPPHRNATAQEKFHVGMLKKTEKKLFRETKKLIKNQSLKKLVFIKIPI